MGTCECVGVFITEIINGVLGVIAQFYQVYGIGVSFTEAQYAIDYLGDKNANTLTGTHSDEIFVAGAGNDTLTGNGGMDVFNAGLLVLPNTT
jgi:Ca2+-binding RTX toxin-like protein